MRPEDKIQNAPTPQCLNQDAAVDTKRALIYRIDRETDELLKKATALRMLRAKLEDESIFTANVVYEALSLLGVR